MPTPALSAQRPGQRLRVFGYALAVAVAACAGPAAAQPDLGWLDMSAVAAGDILAEIGGV